MSKGPGLFADIGKYAKDLLTRDYSTDQKFSISTNSVSGVALTSTALKNGVLHAANVATQYKYRNTFFDVKIDTDFNVKSLVYPMNKFVSIDHNTLTGYDTTSRTFTKYNVGVSVTKPDQCVSIILGDKGDSIKASYVYYLDESTRSATVGEVIRKISTNETTVTVGGLYAVDHLTNVKAKLNSNGKFGVLLQHEGLPKSIVTISGEIDTKTLDKYPRLGLSLSLKP
ncbi:unnamed protein product [Arabidopsis thaliana]|uniref:Uncharacterized protein n=1 Tax=Arabidopsis thaliana TaxID=3702 RepID=A0A5S9XK89_ARATH|nr:unnamed protein product [Arabidopsis thaliana]